MITAEQNIFSLYLDLLGVKHTKAYTSKHYEEHPHKDNLYGLSQMLTDYGVENIGLRCEKAIVNLRDIETPYIIQARGDFGIITEVSLDKVEYYTDGKKISVPHEDFLRMWSGVVLVGEADEKSIEPNYKQNHREVLIARTEKAILLTAIAFILGATVFTVSFSLQIGLITSLLINIIGVYISYFLVLKQMKIHSSYADKLCSLFLHEGDCNNVLESDAAKLLGRFSWSEIGMGYFTANIIMIACIPALYPHLALVNVCSLPFTLWSVWYQKAVAKQWCVLCLLVQATLWLLFINNLSFGLIVLPDLSFTGIIISGCIYLIPILALNLLIPRLSEANQMQEITQKLNSLKADEEIFKSLLNAQPKYDISRQIGIVMGNMDAKNMITVISNPHCNPCAKMHTKLDELLKRTNNGFCLQYVLTSFSEELEESNRLFIGMHKKLKPADFISFLNDWFTFGKNDRLSFYLKYPYNRKDQEILDDVQRQKSWSKDAAIYSTPTVLFNGYKLPDKYKVEDLGYFLNDE